MPTAPERWSALVCGPSRLKILIWKPRPRSSGSRGERPYTLEPCLLPVLWVELLVPPSLLYRCERPKTLEVDTNVKKMFKNDAEAVANGWAKEAGVDGDSTEFLESRFEAYGVPQEPGNTGLDPTFGRRSEAKAAWLSASFPTCLQVACGNNEVDNHLMTLTPI